MSELKFYDGAKVRLRGGEYDEIIPCLKRWQLKRVGLGVSDSGRVLLGTNDQYDVVEILPPEPTIEIGKWYPCRDSKWEASVVEKNILGELKMIGIYRPVDRSSTWRSISWYSDGRVFQGGEHSWDLMLTPPEPKRHTVTYWANCYVKSDGKAVFYGQYLNREDANRGASSDRNACVPYTIEFTEGEGLEPKQP